MTADELRRPWDALTTAGEKYDPVWDITTEADARAHFERCVAHSMRFGGLTREEAERMERSNIGYWSGYQSTTAARVQRLFNCEHPILGKMPELPARP